MAQSAKNNCEICVSARGSEFCLDCCQIFCASCKLTHLRIAVCKNHRFKNCETATLDDLIFCQEHGEAYSFICDECQKAVCRVCTVKTHKGHSMADIEETVSRKRDIFMESLDSFLNSEDMFNFGNVDRQVEEYRSYLDTSTEEAMTGILKQGQLAKDSIDKIVQHMQQQVQDQSAQEKSRLSKALSEINEAKTFKTTLLERKENIRASRNDVGLLAEIQKLGESLHRITLPAVPSLSTIRFTAGQITDDAVKEMLGKLEISGFVEEEILISGEIFDGILSHGTSFLNRINHLKDQVRILKNADDNKALMEFYKNQMLNELSDKFVQKMVRVFITLADKWKSIVSHVIEVLNITAPGLLLKSTANQTKADIFITDTNQHMPHDAISIQWKKLQERYTAVITLGKAYNKGNKQCESDITLQILHALGFHYSMKKLYDALGCHSETKYNEMDNIKRFDPFSILLCGSNHLLDNGVWTLRANDAETINGLSELDKVGLNLLFPPCKTISYQPEVSHVTNLLYCGRRVMEEHNRPDICMTDGRCGPTDGANCPTCRTVVEKQKSKMVRLLTSGQFQGWSGEIYCGKLYKGTTCGPSFGPPCQSCFRLMTGK